MVFGIRGIMIELESEEKERELRTYSPLYLSRFELGNSCKYVIVQTQVFKREGTGLWPIDPPVKG